MATRQQVAQFLRDFKAALTLGHVRWLRRSDQTKAHLSGLEVTRNQAADYLLDHDQYALLRYLWRRPRVPPRTKAD
jgi:hypothetical protein